MIMSGIVLNKNKQLELATALNHLILETNFVVGVDGTATEKGSTQKKWWIWCIIGIMLGVAVVLLGYFCYTRKRKLAVVQQTGKLRR